MTNLSDSQFSRLHNKLMDPNEGGFSVNPQTGRSPKVGYMVALPGYEQQVRSQNIAPAHIREYVEKHKAELDSGKFLGGWNDTDIGEVSLDTVRRIKGDPRTQRRYGKQVAEADAYTSASDLAIANNQKAGWDVKRGKEIPNPGYYDDGRRKDAEAA